MRVESELRRLYLDAMLRLMSLYKECDAEVAKRHRIKA